MITWHGRDQISSRLLATVVACGTLLPVDGPAIDDGDDGGVDRDARLGAVGQELGHGDARGVAGAPPASPARSASEYGRTSKSFMPPSSGHFTDDHTDPMTLARNISLPRRR
jgi:hypothetical protein